MSRLFFALWPDDESRVQLAAVAGQFPTGKSRRIPERNLHITLVFLGETADPLRDRLIVDADKIRVRPFTLTLTHSGWWPRPKVAWLAPDSVPAELEQLAGQLQVAARSAGVELEERPYLPHLSIARKVQRRPAALEFEPIRWEISEFSLMESSAGRAGSEYQVLRRWHLTLP